MDFQARLRRYIKPLENRVMNFMGKCVVSFVNNSKDIQLLQCDFGNGEVRGGIENLGQFGMSSNPLPGAQAVVLFMGGNRDHGIALAVDDGRYRLKLGAGEVAVHNAYGDKVTMKANGDVIVDARAKVQINGATGIELIGVPAGLPIGVVVQSSICSFSGGPHPMGSTSVKATA
jgi:phage baseplate assembly protein V